MTDEEACELECEKIAELLDAAGIPWDNAGALLSLSERVEEALARLKARGHVAHQ
jgi:hypothetical protein